MWHIGDRAFLQDPGKATVPVEVFRVDTTGADLIYGVIDENGRRFSVRPHHLLPDKRDSVKPEPPAEAWWVPQVQYPWSQS